MMISSKDKSASVHVAQLSKEFDGRGVLRGVDLNVPAGQFVAVVGKSGSGKSTLLRLLSGLDQPTAGSVRILNAQGGDASDSVRVVFQEPRLLPWKRVLANVRLGAGPEGTERARAVLQAVGLGDREDDFPALLSGGQRQRVALARALVREPGLLLLDEPFGALDALTRIEAQRLVERLWLDHGFTALLVTHDVGEAVLLADRVFLVDDGCIAEVFEVEVPRAQRREHPEVARIAARVLDAIFHGSSSRSERTGERALNAVPPARADSRRAPRSRVLSRPLTAAR
jgi:sulfonate transport system ATP-binding protein